MLAVNACQDNLFGNARAFESLEDAQDPLQRAIFLFHFLL